MPCWPNAAAALATHSRSKIWPRAAGRRDHHYNRHVSLIHPSGGMICVAANAGKILRGVDRGRHPVAAFRPLKTGLRASLNSFSFAMREEFRTRWYGTAPVSCRAPRKRILRRPTMMATVLGPSNGRSRRGRTMGLMRLMKGKATSCGLKNKVQSARGQRDTGRCSWRASTARLRNWQAKEMIGAPRDVASFDSG